MHLHRMSTRIAVFIGRAGLLLMTVLAGARVIVPDAAWGPEDDAGDRYAIAAIETTHPDFPAWQNPVHVTIRDRRGSLEVVGVARPACPERSRVACRERSRGTGSTSQERVPSLRASRGSDASVVR
jgi:hypothetical protein